MWSLVVALAQAAPTAAAIQADWDAVAPAVAANGATPVHFSAADYAALAAGDTAVHRVDAAAGSFATGAIWVEAPISQAWIAIQDARDRPLGRDMINEWLPGETPARRQVYMRMPLPWPVADRQWVADFTQNKALFDATSGRVWQRRWTLGDPALAPHPDPDAIWTPANEGAWTLLTTSGGTLCILAIHTDVGGSLPTAISQGLAVSSLKSTLRTLATHAADMPGHYRGSHEIVHAPDGAPVPLAP
jgi:hypothetical protein